MGATTRELKHQLFVTAVVDGGQTVKVVLNNAALHDGHGIPESVIEQFKGGVPLNIDPRFPLDLVVSDDGFSANLAFNGSGPVCCYVPWDAVGVFAIGLGGVDWEHEAVNRVPARDPAIPLPEGVIDFAAHKKSR